MERLTERLAIARRALGRLFDALEEPKTAMNRDASIQRFEYSFETVWKAGQAYLTAVENLELASPTSVIRSCFQLGILAEKEGHDALAMARDRNLTVHTYNEELADQIYARLRGHASLMDAWLGVMERRVAE